MRKENRTFYFTVEGQTEQWYLEWLQRIINAEPTTKYTVKFNCKIEKNPLSRIKQLAVISKTDITHIFDYESNEDTYQRQFMATLEQMKVAENSGKNIKYHLGYSNFTFELWIILHKADCNSTLCHRGQYLELINRVYGEHFQNLDHYKKEDNFKRILGQLTLEHVRQAIQRAKVIMKRNQENGYILHSYKGYKFYKENPSLSVWESIEKILKTCYLL
ncbi:RloB domain-containing protein [Acetivibrio straminisolvens]|jgi:hypothetical protein|uniref:Abortive phage resistance protein n=1 Tax=Acetivibrio straminisolvens JCM 21531 TaxID=1294263 RepID=W4VC14_9FIRM|nr:RloB domain-containing protein [Acetivibrio straminisolvens]GAE90299.1 hypothetical protein JCM21531_3894 [Acetivibrio straminisolvens JCM 21531]